MSYGSAWRRETLTLKQIPSLRTLLQCCDEGLLIRVIIDEHAARAVDWDALPPKRRRATEKRLSATLATMRHLPVRKKPKRPGLLLPDESFVLRAGDGLLERRVGASLVFLDEAPHVRRARAACEDEAGLRPHGYTLDPWEDTLAHRVWLGGSWCCRERYLVLASAFWEMTYLGFEYDRVCARRAQVKADRLLEGGASGGGAGVPGEESANGSDENGQAPSSRAASTTVIAERRRQAASYGLAEPDLFELDYRDRLIACVARLNLERRQALEDLLIDVADRLEAS